MIGEAYEESGALARLTLAAGKGNVLSRGVIAALRQALDAAWAHGELRAVVIDAEGRAFSYGAAVDEHRPEQAREMLHDLHALVLELAASPVPVIAAVRGACLGGGLELVLACTRIVVAPDAQLGQPEIRLGVFAPVGSVLLPRRVGEARAAELLLGGESVGAARAVEIGLADELAEDPLEAARAFVRARLLPLSASSLRHAHRALRRSTVEVLRAELAELERLYLEELVPTEDAREGIAAFLEKRAPVWRHR
jgi:cyclohexa-1,5-dienecarbonyl-CoA hydratase